MNRRVARPLLLAFALCVVPSAAAQDDAPPTAEQLAARERIRPKVEALWAEARTPWKPDEERPTYLTDMSDALVALGPDVVPFLAAEIELENSSTLHLCALALGRLDGPEGREILRAAARRAETREGRFGIESKRFVLFGLALAGDPDALDMAQSGHPIQTAGMAVDLDMTIQLAMILGPAAVPVLLRQVETFAADPSRAQNLDFALAALGRVGDASHLPKVAPLLDHPSAAVRARAADVMLRLGEPSTCTSAMPLLADPNLRENYVVAQALGRTKPEPCYTQMLARLEIEKNVEVRYQLYRAITAIAGEGSLEALRLYSQTDNFWDRNNVLAALARTGSKKALPVLRAAMTDRDGAFANPAIDGIARIGGEGAFDTLVTMIAYPRLGTAVIAARLATEHGVARAAPRIASRLLGIVQDPVTDLSQRAPILAFSEMLVTLGYTEPIDDLKVSAAKQGDIEIKGTLESTVRRLEMLRQLGNDVAGWQEALGAPRPEIRRLAARRLAQIGTPSAVRALEVRLASATLAPDERAAIFLEIADARTQGAAPLVEQNLADPAYDAWILQAAREAAAWAAHRIGGERMRKALRTSAMRRDGRDFPTVAYLAVERELTLDELVALRRRRLRYLDAGNGHEEIALDGAAADLRAGRVPGELDAPPDTLNQR